MTLGRVAWDSSKVKANASKHKAMSYGRMREKARQLQAEVNHLLSQAEATDAEENARHGRAGRGDDLPAELQRRESRLQRIREAKRALEARARGEASASDDPGDEAKPADTPQYSFTDPESRIMHHKPEGFVQGYHVQVAVEGILQLIVGEAVTQETNDKQQLRPMITAITRQADQTPAEIVADTVYCSDESLRYLAKTKIDGYVATRKIKHGSGPVAARAAQCRRAPHPSNGWRANRSLPVTATRRAGGPEVSPSTLMPAEILDRLALTMAGTPP